MTDQQSFEANSEDFFAWLIAFMYGSVVLGDLFQHEYLQLPSFLTACHNQAVVAHMHGKRLANAELFSTLLSTDKVVYTSVYQDKSAHLSICCSL